MTTAANFALADDIVHNRLPVRLELGDLADDATALRAGQTIDRQARFNQTSSGLDNLEQKILAGADVFDRIDVRWEQNGDQRESFFTPAEITQLQTDDDAAKKFLKTVSRLIGYSACRQVG